MKLEEYLKQEGLKKGDFARKIPVAPGSLARWLSGRAKPTPLAQERIEQLTKGHVKPKDWQKEKEQ